MSVADVDWFGPGRPQAVDKVLQRTFGGDHTPYEWLARAVAGSAKLVLDLSCGASGLGGRLGAPGRTVITVDETLGCLEPADDSRPLVQADPSHLPFADNAFDAVVTSLGLGLTEDRMQFLAEVSRVLRPGGVFAGLTPSLRPMNMEDLRVASQLGAYLRASPHLAGTVEFRAKTMLAAVGLTKMEDARGRHHFEVRNRADAEILVGGLRQAGDRARASSAIDFLTSRAENAPVRVPLPMRRIVAIK
ncbi:class I SAM-dependent methyltransferase [Tessaracoccus antarcticus]|uniref:class I SAM-dependent methyltransferase n=1 Tax=Tessaracoccus antarcticus TaxID=2479848 RepID=UPI0013143234|nr:class I SAM-dependent methyltransferase [Tessaracoccus antarcticus]